MKVLAYEGISLISRLIRWQTRSEYSHVALELDDGSVIEAWKNGVRHISDSKQDHTPGTTIDIFRIVPEFDQEAAKAFALEQVGKGYDFRSVFRFLTRKPASVNDKWFCSELVHALLSAGGLELLIGSSHDFSPRDICMSPFLQHEDTRIV